MVQNETRPDVTVVIPVYNVQEEYLKQCLDSVINQSLANIEIICVSDGAGAENIAILEEYAQKDARIKLIKQENSGVCVARNRAFNEACGRYITCVDSDDTITENNLKEAADYADKNSLDVLMWGMNLCYPNKTVGFSPYVEDIPVFSDKQKEEVQFKTLVGILPFYVTPPASSDAAGSACAKLYRTDFLRENNLNYTPGLKRAEDMFFNLQVFSYADRIGNLSGKYYNYRQNEQSATYMYRENGIEVFTDSLKAIKGFLESEKKSDLFWQVYYMRCMFFFLESMDMDYFNRQNTKPLSVRIKQMKEVAATEPYREAFCNLTGEYLTFARKIPLFLIKHDMMFTLALFYKAFTLIKK